MLDFPVATVNGVDVYLDEDGEVVYPECVGCGAYFNDGPCEECGREEE